MQPAFQCEKVSMANENPYPLQVTRMTPQPFGVWKIQQGAFTLRVFLISNNKTPRDHRKTNGSVYSPFYRKTRKGQCVPCVHEIGWWTFLCHLLFGKRWTWRLRFQSRRMHARRNTFFYLVTLSLFTCEAYGRDSWSWYSTLPKISQYYTPHSTSEHKPRDVHSPLFTLSKHTHPSSDTGNLKDFKVIHTIRPFDRSKREKLKMKKQNASWMSQFKSKLKRLKQHI